MTPTAKNIVSIITKEVRLQLLRVAGGHIKDEDVERYVVERLNRLSQRDPDVKAFTQQLGYVDPREDEDPDVEWAEDPREAGQHEVRSKVLPAGAAERPGRMDGEETAWPSPGERIC